jgi:geranylgeranyl diphosphate synthase type II
VSVDTEEADFRRYLVASRKLVEGELQARVPRATVRPKTLHKAMRHSLFAGGKRLRPILCLAAAEACGGEGDEVIAAALIPGAAIECLHTYSLIHDDLPCMDDDDFRRGNPTCHKVFGEGIAVLAGDALLTQAFEIAASVKPTKRYTAGDFVKELAETGGSKKLVGGQVLDLEGEGRGEALTLAELRRIHEGKTAALLGTSVRFGGMSANATPRQLAALSEFGHALGLAFQVIDDILDVTQTTEKLGKSAGKDEAVGKSTYPALMGLDRSRAEADRLTKVARDALRVFGAKGARRLRQLADYLLERDY